jgi:hypothetical protein
MQCSLIQNFPAISHNKKTAESIADNWQKFIAWRPTEDISSLCRLIKHEDNIVHIANDVTYKDVVGLRWQKQLSTDSAPFKVVTAIALVRTSDNHLVLIPRDSGDWSKSLECPGGFIRASYLSGGDLSVDEFIRKRVVSDLNLHNEQIDDCTYLTVFDANNILEWMLVYAVQLTLHKDELLERHPTFVVVPPEYTTDTHELYSSISLHSPSRGALIAVNQLHRVHAETLATQ